MHITRVPRPEGVPYSLAVHGGAGARRTALTAAKAADCHEGLRRALTAGQHILCRGGTALDAVCAAVVELEDDPLFNAGHGAALTGDGTAELDAAVMTGTGAAGAVAASTFAHNPVLAARCVMERTPHVLLVAPTQSLLESWGLHTAAPERLRHRPSAGGTRPDPARTDRRRQTRHRGGSGPRRRRPPRGRNLHRRHHQPDDRESR